MKSNNLIFQLMSAAIVSMMLTACTSENQSYQLVKPEKSVPVFGKAEVSQDGLVINIDKRVDILFVIDDSFSMDAHQTNLAKNIDRFVDGLANKSKDIDFHIAVTTVHDSTRYLEDNSVVPRTCTFPDGKVETFWDDVGTLKPLKGTNVNQRFISNSESYKDILKQTLKVGAQPFYEATGIQNSPSGVWSCTRGPEQEDIFNPMLSVLSANPPKANAGFRRPGAFLVVILVTDAKDASGMNADSVYEQLKTITGDRIDGKRKLRVFAVAMNKGDKARSKTINGANHVYINGRDCKPDPAFGYAKDLQNTTIPDHEVIKLARLTGDNQEDGESQVLSICSDFGPTLANFSAKIVQDVVPDVTVEIPQLPDMGKTRLKVLIGEKELNEGKDWDYNSQFNEITIYSSQVDWSLFEGQQVRVQFEPVDPDAPTTKPITD